MGLHPLFRSGGKGSCFFDSREIPEEAWDPDPTRVARYIKTHPHTLLSEYKATLWIDGNIVLRHGPLESLIKDYLESGIDAAFRRHPERSCVYQELLKCYERRKDSFAVMYKQVSRYRRLGYLEAPGLFETNVIFRSNNSEQVRCFNEIWWAEIQNGSRRDQLSVMACIKQSKIKFKLIQECTDIRNLQNPLYYLQPHQSACETRMAVDVHASSKATFSPILYRKLQDSISIPEAVHNGLLLLTELGQADSGKRLLQKLTQPPYRQRIRSHAAFCLAMHFIDAGREEAALSLLEQQIQNPQTPRNLSQLLDFLLSDIKLRSVNSCLYSCGSSSPLGLDSVVQLLHRCYDVRSEI